MKTSKAFDKLARQEKKLLEDTARLKLLIAREENRISKLRNCIPFPNSKAKDADVISGTGVIRCFDIDQDESKSAEVMTILSDPEMRYKKILDSIALALNCDPSLVVLLEVRTSYKGKPNLERHSFQFRHHYNERFHTALKETQEAKFDRQIKAWRVEIKDEHKPIVEKALSEHFQFVVTLPNSCVYTNKQEPPSTANKSVAFRPLSFTLRVDKQDVRQAIEMCRESEGDGDLFISDGDSFTKWDQNSVLTSAPFLLVRYSVPRGRPRYLAYSTLGKCIETFGYGNNAKVTSQLIARYRDCSTFWGKRFLDFTEGTNDSPDDQWQKHRSEFQMFQGEIDRACAPFHDLLIVPLMSDQVTLFQRGFGFDAKDSGILAYVYTDSEMDDYLSRIASFFTPQGTLREADITLPVVFERGYTSASHMDGVPDFTRVLCHEMAHGFIASTLGISFQEDGCHDEEWAVCHAIIHFLVVGQVIPDGDYAKYHSDPDEIASVRAAIASIDMNALKAQSNTQPLTVNAVVDTLCSALEGRE